LITENDPWFTQVTIMYDLVRNCRILIEKNAYFANRLILKSR